VRATTADSKHGVVKKKKSNNKGPNIWLVKFLTRTFIFTICK